MTSPGSSPHTRGAPPRTRPPPMPTRIIPAYAGSTRQDAVGDELPGDHPRIRGEHAATGPAESQGPGSSPHTRGAPLGVGDAGDESGIIPAYAGSTGRYYLAHSAPDGSSPHTRGAPGRTGRRPRGGGIIPAYAGSTKPAGAGPSAPQDHPRIRGEHLIDRAREKNVTGSSPHTRGAPLCRLGL